MKLSYVLTGLTISIIAQGASQVWSSLEPAAPPALPEVKEAPKHEGDDAKGRAHPLSGKTVTVADLGAIQTVYMGLADGIWQRGAGGSGVLTFGKKVGDKIPYPHVTFGKECIDGVVAVHYSLSKNDRVQFSYDLITGTGPTHIRNEGAVPPGQTEGAQTKVATFMGKFRDKVNTILASKR
jgi:hypothetical protein